MMNKEDRTLSGGGRKGGPKMGQRRIRDPEKFRRPLRTKRLKRSKLLGDFQELSELKWMDQLLRSFNEATPEEWLPAQYQSLFHQDWAKKPTLH